MATARPALEAHPSADAAAKALEQRPSKTAAAAPQGAKVLLAYATVSGNTRKYAAAAASILKVRAAQLNLFIPNVVQTKPNSC